MTVKSLDRDELRELLVKCWMTHDGMWFYQCKQEYGIDAANRLNRAAIRSLAPVEVHRVAKALGIKSRGIETFDGLKVVIVGMFQTIKGDFMDFTFEYPEENALRWEMNRCFALEGMKMIGASEQYECGVLYRVFCWFDEMGLKYVVEPTVEGCLMRDTGSCSGIVRFEF